MRSSAGTPDAVPQLELLPPQLASAGLDTPLIASVRAAAQTISTLDGHTLKSDDVLKALAPALQAQGFTVELGKTVTNKIRRPVLFGENGRPSMTYEIDAWHEQHHIAVEVEAGRGPQNNADYRDIIRTSMILDAEYLAY